MRAVIITMIFSCSFFTLVKATPLSYNLPDTTKPFYREINKSGFYGFNKQIQEFLKSEDLQNGFDGFEVRIWEYFLNIVEVTCIYKKDSVWKATITRINVGSPYDSKWKFSLQSSIPVTPRSGWTEFSEKLLESRIMTLPDDLKLPKGGVVSDGIAYDIEVATRDIYRFYSYNNPDIFKKGVPERQYFIDIRDYIFSELK